MGILARYLPIEPEPPAKTVKRRTPVVSSGRAAAETEMFVEQNKGIIRSCKTLV